MNLNAKIILNHKVVAIVNLLWAIFHIWIVITIWPEYFFLAIVIVFVLIFIGAYWISENKARYIFLVIGLLYFFPISSIYSVSYYISISSELMSDYSSMFDTVGSLIWLVVIALILLAGTAQWTGALYIK